ncbi:MAG: RNA polymerase sigma factor [Desulfuromonas sp.]|nr:MAG: RNA polymerase sigma factor [Desulfuromonas sp.]
MQPSTEKILIDQARDGRDHACTQLVEAHSEKIIGLAWRLVGQRDVAEEIAQEAFLRFFQSIHTFRGESTVGTWLYRTTTRLAIDHLRRERLKRKIFFFKGRDPDLPDPVETYPDSSGNPQENLVAAETGARMQQVLERLPARQKAVFVLRHMEQLSLKEIAATLDLELGTVKAHLHRAVNQFRREYEAGEKE